MEKEAKLRFQEIKDRQYAYNLLSDDEKMHCERIAHNTQMLYILACEKNVYPDYKDLNLDLAKYIFEASKYFYVGHAIEKVVYPDSNNDVPIQYVNLGRQIFYKGMRKNDVLALSEAEKNIRRFAQQAACSHLEQWNGKGLPDGLKMEEIPVIARIVHIFVKVEHMMLDPNATKEEVVAKMQEASGGCCDPRLTNLFCDNSSMFVFRDEEPIDALQYVIDLKLRLKKEQDEKLAKEKAELEALEQQKQDEKNELEKQLRKEISDELKAKEKRKAKEEAIAKRKAEAKEKIEKQLKSITPAGKETIGKINEKRQDARPKRLTKEQCKKAHKPYFLVKDMKPRPVEMRYSPMYDLKNNDILFLLSELVINTKYYGRMSPAVYETVAEKSGQIADMINLGVEQLVEMYKIADEYDIPLPKTSIKIYRKLFDRKTFFPRLIKIFKKNHLEKKIVFILSEDVLASGSKMVYDTIAEFRELGIEIGVTDLGSEYNLIKRLSKLQFDYLIVDQKYLTDIAKDTRAVGIIKGFKNIATSFKVKLVCQGITNPEQVEALKNINVNRMQGNIFGESVTMFDILA